MESKALIALIFSLIAFFVAGCTMKKVEKDTFVFCSVASPKIFNPQLSTDGATFNASSRTMYNRIVEFKTGTTDVIPSLAKSWKVSSDGKTYTFQLRNDVDFHTTEYFTPTRKFNADDIVFTIKRMHDKNHPYHTVNGGTYKFYASMDMGNILKDIRKVNDYSVEIELTKPQASFLANLAMDFASILSKEYGDALAAQGNKEQIDIKPIGTGPFKFRRYVKDTMVRYQAHETYFGEVPSVKNLIFSVTPDPSVRTQKLRAGECHFVNEPAPTDLAGMEKDPNIKIQSLPGLNVGYLAFNVEKKPFDNVLVRRAIHHALNRESYIDAIYLGNASVAKNPIPPTMWSYDESTKDYEYNVEKAKALLKQAGLSDGFETTIWTLPVSRPYNPNGKKMGEMMQADLAKVGIKVKLRTYKWAEYLKRAGDGEHDMVMVGWSGDNGDPDNFLFVLLGCAGIEGKNNFARFCHKEFQSVVDRAQVISDKRERTKLYKKAQAIFKREVPWVTLAHSKVFKAMAKNVEGYIQSPLTTDDLYGVELK